MRYPGGKNGCGAYHRIINQIPPHRVYIEPFAGSAAVLRRLRPAERMVAVDRDVAAIAALRDVVPPHTELVRGDGIDWLGDRLACGAVAPDWVVYCDPPYLHATRSKKRIYRHEMTEADHRRLLGVLVRMPCRVLLSGYRSGLYRSCLRSRKWRSIDYRAMTRGGLVTETLWANFPEPTELHDYRYLGDDYRQREKLRRQQRRWVARLKQMNTQQRQALLAAIDSAGLVSAANPAQEYATAGK